jgi:amino acid transporter
VAIAPDQRPLPTPPLGFLSRIFGDGLLAYTCYATLFVGVFNSGTNVLQIGRETLIAIHPDEEPNGSLVRFIGVFALMMICLIQLFSSRAGRVLNRFLALVKITFLIVLFVFGCAFIGKHGGATHFTEKIPNLPAFNYAQALLVVLYSYDGWENATFVSASHSRACHRLTGL